MSLTQEDLQQIRTLFREEVAHTIDEKLQPVLSELKALREDIKEIYSMITELQSATITDKDFKNAH